MKKDYLTEAEAKLAAADWLLMHDRQHVCSNGNVLGERFLSEFVLPDTFELFDRFAGDGEIILLFSMKIRLTAQQSVSGKAESFLIQKYVAVGYDENGSLTGERLLGYRC